jgi:hypothetical protein
VILSGANKGPPDPYSNHKQSNTLSAVHKGDSSRMYFSSMRKMMLYTEMLFDATTVYSIMIDLEMKAVASEIISCLKATEYVPNSYK